MDNIDIARRIVELSGGKRNIVSNSVYKTELIIKLKKLNKVEITNFMEIGEALGVSAEEGNIIKILFRADRVNLIGEELSKITRTKLNEVTEEERERSREQKESQEIQKISSEISQKIEKIEKEKIKEEKRRELEELKKISPFSRFLRKILNVFLPLLPVLVAAGFIQGVTNIADVLPEGKIFIGTWWYQVLKTIGWMAYTYLPVFVCMNATKEFKGNKILGGVIGLLFVGNSAMPLLGMVNRLPVILPFSNKPYFPEIGGLLIALVAGIIAAFIERGLRKIIPGILKDFFVPLMTLIISAFAVIFITQPFGGLLVKQIYESLNVLFEQKEILGGLVLSILYFPLSLVGLQGALISINSILNDPEGPTRGLNYILPILMMASGGQIGAAFAIFIKTKNRKMKKVIRGVLPVSILGVTEPLIYTVTLPLIRPFITACIGAGAGGALAAFFNLSTEKASILGFFGFLTVAKGTHFFFITAMMGAYLGGFILTYFFGINEKRINEVYGK